MKIAITTEFGENYRNIWEICVPVFEKYCSRYGYVFAPLWLVDGNDYAFKKHEWVKELFKIGYDLIWYLDCDALITNHNIRIEEFIDDEHDFFITKDFNELNGGSIVIKNTEYGRWLNDFIIHNEYKFDNEQNLINHHYNNGIKFREQKGGYDYFSSGMKILPHPSINSYDYSCYPECKEYIGREDLGDWKPGNFVIHFPGLGLNDRVELMKEYSQKIIE